MTGRQKQDLIGNISARDPGGVNMLVAAAKSAARSRVSCAGVALSVVAALGWGLAGLWLIPAVFLGSFAWTLLVRSSALADKRDAAQRPIVLPDPMDYSDAAVQEALQRLASSRERVASTLRAGPRGTEFDLSVVDRLTPAIERRIVMLAARAEYLSGFLSGTSIAEHRAGLNVARTRERTIDDAETKALYRRVIALHEADLDSIRRLDAERHRYLATIDCLLTTLEALPANMTRVQSVRLAYGDDATDPVGDAAQVLETLSGLEQAFERQSAPPQLAGCGRAC